MVWEEKLKNLKKGKKEGKGKNAENLKEEGMFEGE